MTEDEKATALQDAADRIVASRRRQAANDIALRLLAETGEVKADTVAAKLEEEWAPPDAQQLLDLLARKMESGVVQAAKVVDLAEGAAERMRLKTGKAAKVAEVWQTETSAATGEAERGVDAARKELEDIKELAEAAFGLGGNPANVPPGEPTNVSAQVASVSAQATRGKVK